MKLLGFMIQNDLRWEAQVAHMVTKASKKIWLLRRMRQLGVDEKTITTYWVMEGRSTWRPRSLSGRGPSPPARPGT